MHCEAREQILTDAPKNSRVTNKETTHEHK